MEALFSILEGYRQNNSHALPFWASCIYSSNDSREMELGYDTIKKILPKYENNCPKSMNISEVYNNKEYEKQCKDKFFEKPIEGLEEVTNVPYMISFSCKEDFLPMWSMYGDDKQGVCMKFNLSSLITHLKGNLQMCFVHYEGDEDNIIRDYLFPILYEFDAERNKGTQKMTVDDKIEELSLICYCISPFVKSNDWSYESEFRLVFHEHYGPQYTDDFFNGLQVAPNKIKVKNHVTLPIFADSLEEIILGPLANYNVWAHVLHNELIECGLSNVEISQSSIRITK